MKKSALKPKKKTWESKTWNGDRNEGEEPVFTTLGKPKLGLQEPKSSSGGGVIMAVILLIIMICVAIFLVHKRQQMIKEEMKKQDAEAMKEDEANKKSTFMPVQAATMEKVSFLFSFWKQLQYIGAMDMDVMSHGLITDFFRRNQL